MANALKAFKNRTLSLATSRLFRPLELLGRPLSNTEQWFLTVQRAIALVKTMGLNLDAIQDLTDEWWAAQLDPIFAVDPAICTVVWIQLNLVAGTLAMYSQSRLDLRLLITKILNFDVSGHFCLTELDHGLDARNLETTATQLPGGGFDLHTPHHGAGKFMPPTAPSGLPSTAIVFARLIVGGNNHGIRCFLVEISDEEMTYPGITVRIIHGRAGCKPVNHSITSFNHVKLPASALLGEPEAASLQVRDDFSRLIWRVAVGTLAFVGPVISALKVSCHIAGKYSQRRTVAGPSSEAINARGHSKASPRVPIISFSTQYRPILAAIANVFVLEAFYWRSARSFSDPLNSYNQRHAVATILKVLSQRLVQNDLLSLSERCGVQGLFAHNQIASLVNEIRGVGIAEGDAFVLSLRLVSELLTGKYSLPAPDDSKHVLYAHEEGLFNETREDIRTIGHHRSDAFNQSILPRCEEIALSIGHRMAYEAALDAGLSPQITNLYLASAVQANEGWFAEKMKYSREDQFVDHAKAVQEALPCLDEWLKKLDVEDYVWAPIVDRDRWMAFFHNLEIAPSHQPVKRETELKARL